MFNIHSEGYSSIFIGVLVTGLAAYAGLSFLVVLPLAFTLFLIYFFRDPERTIPTEKNIVISPADGTVKWIREEGNKMLVHIFLSPWDVHVNRAPIAGRVHTVLCKHGKRHPAFSKKIVHNEENAVRIHGALDVTSVQIVGIFARRIKCWVKENDNVKLGERYGMIKFGSGTRLELPKNVEVLVKPGEHVIAGETIMARYL